MPRSIIYIVRHSLFQISIIIALLFLSCALRPDFRYTNVERDRRRDASWRNREQENRAKPNTLPSLEDARINFMDRSTFTNFKEQVRLFWQTPYLWGGASSNGADCSGLVYVIYRNGLGITVPRSTHELFSGGKSISKGALRLTDLVFFTLQSRTHPDHVGIYIAKGFFLHASVSRGVTLSHLDDPPYKKKYLGARRYFE
ncbi:C40 family peptidase [candidate division KSB1 bacterium]|nr:C40 family peptidase [candidate division KSB1 bacterium]